MKGIHGLIFAVGLGIVGALFNWAYLAGKASQDEMIAFVGIKKGKTINRGEILRESDIEPVRIPLRAAGNLQDYAVKYREGKQDYIAGEIVYRNLTGGCLLMRDDLNPPPAALRLEEGESAWGIPVDTRTFVPSLVKPGDMVSFLVDRASLPTPAVHGRDGTTPAGNADGDDSSSSQFKPIGPFMVLAVGNRLSSAQAMRSAKIPQVQENVLSIRVSDHVAGERQRAEQLWRFLKANNFRNVGVILHNVKK